MARPQKNNADYFTHDANMRNDLKIRALRRKYGLEGYAIWVFLLEVLTDADFFRVEWDDFNIELLAGDFDIESEKLGEVVEYCAKLKLVTISDGYLESPTHQGRFENLVERRTQDRERKTKVSDKENESGESFPSGKPTESRIFHKENEAIREENTQSREEKSRVENNREEKSVCESAPAPARTREELNNEKQFGLFPLWLEKNAPSVLDFEEPLTYGQFCQLYKTYGAERIKQCAREMHNKRAADKNRNAMTTFSAWLPKIDLTK